MNQSRHLMIHASIFKIIEDYHKPIPIEYLAKLLGRHPEDIRPHINRLKQENLIEIFFQANIEWISTPKNDEK